jgi:bacillolysin
MPKPTQSQKAAFKNLQQIDPSTEIQWDEKTGTPARLRGVLSGPQDGAPETIARQFLAANKGVFAMKAPEDELQLKGVVTDARGNRHVRFQQMSKGLPVFGGEMIVHMDPENAVRGANASFTAKIDVPHEPSVEAREAKKTALDDVADNKEQPGAEPLLLILIHEGKPHLAWHLSVAGTDKDIFDTEVPALWEYFVDASSGEVLWKYNNLQSHGRTTGLGDGQYAGDSTINTLHDHAANTYLLEDLWMPSTARVRTHDCDSGSPPGPTSRDSNNNWSGADQGSEVDCHEYSRMFFDYFLVMHGRDSYDDAGADLDINAHVGTNYANAYWSPAGRYVAVGDGDGVRFGPLCAPDIIAHEWMHAVTTFSANLTYYGESGALNESFSDLFAALITGDWLMGEDVWLGTTSPALRNIADPTNGDQYDPSDPIGSVRNGHQPDHMDDKYTGTADNAGVHINSGIMNKAGYLIVTGGTHRGIKICEGLGTEVTARLYYHALTSILTQNANFAAMRDAALDALHELYDGDPRYKRWRASIINAFAAVGIGSAVACPGVCWAAPIECRLGPSCPPSPTICRVTPGTCPPSPELCRMTPILCRIAPIGCTVAPVACRIDPAMCAPAPGGGCLPGPDPKPFRPEMKPR